MRLGLKPSLFCLVIAALPVCMAQKPDVAGTTVVVVVGAEGAPEYARQFATWTERWHTAAELAGANYIELGRGDSPANTNDRERLRQVFLDQPKEGTDDLWLVLIGHGTSDNHAARFNLRGPDISDAELAEMLAPFKRPLIVIDGSACSGPFINRLSGPNRVVITATRSGNEQNYARFGEYLSSAILDQTADYDRDGQVSLLEAFLAGSRRLAEFYRGESRLATEHPLLDDNGDGFGTPGDWFRGLRATKRARDGAMLDGYRAHQCVLVRSSLEQRIPLELRRERDRLELAVANLRDRKESVSNENEYYKLLEELLVQLAKLQEQIDATR